MNGYKLALLIWLALGTLALIVNVGKPRKPTTPEQAALGLIFVAIHAALVVAA